MTAIDLDIWPRQIHALLGENGAGKSTLVKIIYGLIQPSDGEMRWQGEKMVLSGPSEARARGIGMVFQHFSLFDNLTVAENVALGLDGKESLHGHVGAPRAKCPAFTGLPLDPRREVWQLSVGERQRIEIVRALMQNPKLLILDEPTAVLTPQEADQLFIVLERLQGRRPRDPLHQPQARRGEAALRHRHHPARRQEGRDLQSARGDRGLARAHDGRRRDRRGEGRRQPANHGAAAGRQRPQPRRRTIRTACGLTDISFELKGGEILGIAGVAGNGQDELVRRAVGRTAGAGSRHASSSTGTPRGTCRSPQRRRLGAAFVPEERLGHATAPRMRLSENALLTGHAASGMVQHGFVDTAATLTTVDRTTEAFDVRKAKRDPEAASLSGGNLQKFVVGREILREPGRAGREPADLGRRRRRGRRDPPGADRSRRRAAPRCW